MSGSPLVTAESVTITVSVASTRRSFSTDTTMSAVVLPATMVTVPLSSW